MYLFDTREKSNDHIKLYFARHNIPYAVQKLDVGDYMTSTGNISIDRKQSLDELAANLMTKDHTRFWNEIRRAKENGIKLIVLCEHGGKVKSLPDVAKWNSRYSKIKGVDLMKELYRIHISYGVEILFCSKRSTGKKIVELLGGSVD